MDALFILITLQAAIGLYDNLRNHEWHERLPAQPTARNEMALHAARHFLYAVIFASLAWLEWGGWLAWAFIGLLALEGLVTLADFVEEDRSRRLSANERVVHAILTLNYGAVLALLIPIVLGWSGRDVGLHAVDHGGWSWVMTLFAAGVLLWGIRDAIAVWHLTLRQTPTWQRVPLDIGTKAAPRHFLVTGATGLIGRALCRKLLRAGETVTVLTRDPRKAEDLFGPHAMVLTDVADYPDEKRLDIVINLAGAPVIGVPWTRGRRSILMDSRVGITRDLVALIRRRSVRPTALISASAVGFYGNSDDRLLDEKAFPGTGFATDLCQNWEAAAMRAEALGVRVCRLRLGLVLSATGGALASMLPAFRLGLGGRLGSGRQWMSWIHIDDVIRLILHLANTPSLRGPINGTAPEPVRNAVFTKALARGLRRPALFPVPGWLVRPALGEMGDVLFEGQRVLPNRALETGFRFRYETLEAAMTALFDHHKAQATEARGAEGTVTTFYNGACPVCRTEIGHYQKLRSDVSGTQPALSWCDLSEQPDALSQRGISREGAIHRLHAVDGTGRVLVGVDAFIAIWERMPAYRWLAAIVRRQPFRWIAGILYERVAVPWLAWLNRRRAASAPAYPAE